MRISVSLKGSVALALCLATPAFAATVTGAVTGPDGKPVAGVFVVAQDAKTKRTVNVLSGAVTGLRAVDPDLMRLFDLYGATRMQRLTRLRLPSAIPFVLEGHKVAAGLAIVGAVVAEFVAGSGKVQGLAWRILEAGNRLQTAKMFAALVVLGVLGAVLHALLEAGERAGLRWWRGR